LWHYRFGIVQAAFGNRKPPPSITADFNGFVARIADRKNALEQLFVARDVIEPLEAG
jgi:hypothetical protein